MPAVDARLLSLTKELRGLPPADRTLAHADLRGADLSGLSLMYASLAHANLDGANLAGAHLRQVDLSHASLRDACLERAHLELVDAAGVCLAGARAPRSRWELVDLTLADLTGADLSRALLRNCELGRARLDGVDLTLSTMARCDCRDARLCGALIDRVNAAGSGFEGADLTGARRFCTCREVLVELMRREVGHDLSRARLVGAFALVEAWCYAEWARILEFEPHYREVLCELFRRYPESGLLEALERGAEPSPSDEAQAPPEVAPP
ncbi:MAG: pentapeptide repeat-containing protein [Anaerolineae bacterium]|nr:pentapeptide repeat-containing protein [Anaerolineae bacterium]